MQHRQRLVPHVSAFDVGHWRGEEEEEANGRLDDLEAAAAPVLLLPPVEVDRRDLLEELARLSSNLQELLLADGEHTHS